MFVKVAIVAFCVAFVGVIGASETIKKFARSHGPPEYDRSCDYSEEVTIIAYYSL